MSTKEELAGQVMATAEKVEVGAANLIDGNITEVQGELYALVGNTGNMQNLEGPLGYAKEAASNALQAMAALQEAIRSEANRILAGG